MLELKKVMVKRTSESDAKASGSRSLAKGSDVTRRYSLA